LVCRHDHHLAGRKRLKLQDLLGVDLIRYARSGILGQHLELAMRGIALNEVMEVEQLPTVSGLVSAGLGVSVVPSVAAPFFEPDKVVVIPIVAAGLGRPIHLVSQTSRVLGAAAQAFVDLVEASLEEHGRPPAPARIKA